MFIIMVRNTIHAQDFYIWFILHETKGDKNKNKERQMRMMQAT